MHLLLILMKPTLLPPHVAKQPAAHAAEHLAALGALQPHLPHQLAERLVVHLHPFALGSDPSRERRV